MDKIIVVQLQLGAGKGHGVARFTHDVDLEYFEIINIFTTNTGMYLVCRQK